VGIAEVTELGKWQLKKACNCFYSINIYKVITLICLQTKNFLNDMHVDVAYQNILC